MATKTTTSPDAPHDVQNAMDYAEHERTYNGFMRLTKWTVIATAISVVILYFLIRP